MGQKQPLPWDGQSSTQQEEEANVTLFLSVCLPWSPACLVCPVASPQIFSFLLPEYSSSLLIFLSPSLSLSRAQRPGQAPLPWPSCSSGPGPLTGTSYPPCGLLDSQGPGVPESSLPDPGPPSRVPSSLGSPQLGRTQAGQGRESLQRTGRVASPGERTQPRRGRPSGDPTGDSPQWEGWPGPAPGR